jgi:hypothetical protein
MKAKDLKVGDRLKVTRATGENPGVFGSCEFLLTDPNNLDSYGFLINPHQQNPKPANGDSFVITKAWHRSRGIAKLQIEWNDKLWLAHPQDIVWRCELENE